MKITVLIDPETFVLEDPQFEAGSAETCREVEFQVTEALRHLGHHTTVIPFQPNISETVQMLLEQTPELVFNLTEHHRLTKQLLRHHRIHVPNFAMVPVGSTYSLQNLAFPIIVKPGFEDGSEGIANASIVHNEQELANRVTMLHDRMKQTLICEEYIEGREIYVAMTGNPRIACYPAREVYFGDNREGPQIATARVKFDKAYRQKWGVEFRQANLDPDMERRAAGIARRAFKILQLRDYGRIDLRIRKDGTLVILEANPNPDLTLGDEVADAAQYAGVSYEKLIERIIKLAVQRSELKQ